MSKKKILIFGISMDCGGTEVSLLRALDGIDFDKYDIELLLARRGGEKFSYIPPEVKVSILDSYNDFFLLDGKNAKGIIFRNFIISRPGAAVKCFRAFIKSAYQPKRRKIINMRLWVSLIKYIPDYPGKYDAAIAFWGDKTMFYIIDKINANKKYSWMHFDFDNPPREKKLYYEYFAKSDRVISVSKKLETDLKKRFPGIFDKFITVENSISIEAIKKAANEAATFEDEFKGIRIVSVGRLVHSKGHDIALCALKILISRGYDIKMYIIGPGNKTLLEKEALKLGLSERFCIMGVMENALGYIGDCDIYIHPSRSEGKPLAVYEAMALCVPIVAGCYFTADEQLEGGKYGLICKSESPQELSDNIELLINHPDRQASLRDSLTKRQEENKQSDFNIFLDSV